MPSATAFSCGALIDDFSQNSSLDFGRITLVVAVMVLRHDGRCLSVDAMVCRLAQCAGVGHTQREAEQPPKHHLGCPSPETLVTD